MTGRFDTVGQKFLRGYQLTDTNGIARFLTIYPSWYQGRTVHIHFKIRTERVLGRAYEFTGQLYFEDKVTDGVMRQTPYASRAERSMRNQQDGIYRRGGDRLVDVVMPAANGYTGAFDIGVQLS